MTDIWQRERTGVDRSPRRRRMRSGKETRESTANQDASASFCDSLLMVVHKKDRNNENADKPKDIVTLFSGLND